MKFFHISDIHIGKSVNEFSMLSEQKFILNQVIDYAKEHTPDGVLIAGDVYDKSVPSAEAVEIFNDFLTELAGLQPVYIISGNHDSPERLSFGNKLMEKNNVFIAGRFKGKMDKHTLNDINIYLMPFIKPAVVRPFYPDNEITTYEDAFKVVLESENIDSEKINILVAHQFITAGQTQPDRSMSESISVGGVDNIDASIFKNFDYVALGHLHNPQKIGRDTIRYCGSPLKYSFSECRYNKSITMIDICEKNKANINFLPLTPNHDMRQIKGNLKDLINPEVYSMKNREDYLQVTLTDEEDILDPMGKLRQVYPNIMRLDIENSRTTQNNEIKKAEEISQKTNIQLFCEFYKLQNNNLPDENKMKIITEIFEKLESKEDV